MFDLINTDAVRDMFRDAFPFTESESTGFAAYRNRAGEEIALQLGTNDAYYVWVQRYDGSVSGVEVHNEQSPGEPYAADQPRHPGLDERLAPQLQTGSEAWCLKAANREALAALIAWYRSS